MNSVINNGFLSLSACEHFFFFSHVCCFVGQAGSEGLVEMSCLGEYYEPFSLGPVKLPPMMGIAVLMPRGP